MWEWETGTCYTSTTGLYVTSSNSTWSAPTSRSYVRYVAASPTATAPTYIRDPREELMAFYAYQRRVQREILDAHDEAAKVRAEELLMSFLTEQQQKTFKENNWFVIKGGKSDQKYRINGQDLIANIDVMDRDRVSYKLCGHLDPKEAPLCDHLLAQKIMLETSEMEFLRLANRHTAAA